MRLLTSQWVRLAVEKINSCHTLSAVEQAFHEFPRGMEAIYDRMAVTIAEHQSSADTALAQLFFSVSHVRSAPSQ